MTFPQTGIRDFPDLAAEIGALVADFTLLEMLMHGAYRQLTGASDDDADAKLGSKMNISQVFEIVFKEAEARPNDDPLANAILSVKTDIESVQEMRNRLCHSLYTHDLKGNWTIASQLFYTKRGDAYETAISPDIIEIERRKIYAVYGVLLPLIKSMAVGKGKVQLLVRQPGAVQAFPAKFTGNFD